MKFKVRDIIEYKGHTFFEVYETHGPFHGMYSLRNLKSDELISKNMDIKGVRVDYRALNKLLYDQVMRFKC